MSYADSPSPFSLRGGSMRLLRLAYPYYAPVGQRWLVYLCRADKLFCKPRQAFLDPRRVGNYYKIVIYVAKEGEVIMQGGHPTALKAVMAHAVEYDSNHPFYDPYTLSVRPQRNLSSMTVFTVYEAKACRRGSDDDCIPLQVGDYIPGKLMNLADHAEPCGNGLWRPYLSELEEYDEYCWNAKTAMEILVSNIHPVYGLMD